MEKPSDTRSAELSFSEETIRAVFGLNETRPAEYPKSNNEAYLGAC
jgi:hypothetical protein